jgi:hypothetical protein
MRPSQITVCLKDTEKIKVVQTKLEEEKVSAVDNNVPTEALYEATIVQLNVLGRVKLRG